MTLAQYLAELEQELVAAGEEAENHTDGTVICYNFLRGNWNVKAPADVVATSAGAAFYSSSHLALIIRQQYASSLGIPSGRISQLISGSTVP